MGPDRMRSLAELSGIRRLPGRRIRPIRVLSCDGKDTVSIPAAVRSPGEEGIYFTATTVNSPGSLSFVHAGCSSNFFNVKPQFMTELMISLIVYFL